MNNFKFLVIIGLLLADTIILSAAEVKFSANKLIFGQPRPDWEVVSTVENCSVGVIVYNRDGNHFRLEKELECDSLGTACKMIERYELLSDRIHGTVTVKGIGEKDWSLPIVTRIAPHGGSPSPTLRYWTAWGSPNVDTLALDVSMRRALREYKGGCDAAKGWSVLGGEKNNRWVDPLIPVPFTDSKYFYGAVLFYAEDPMTGFVPAQNDLFAIPMISFIETDRDWGMSVILSPRDSILDLELETQQDGTVIFRRVANRIKVGQDISFSFDIVFHDPDWRSGVATAARLYPDYFYPKNEESIYICGTGAYSAAQEIKDVEVLKKMSFGVNWQASFDFPYMGMFIPPVSKGEKWETFGYTSGTTKNRWQTIEGMNEVSKEFKENGFYSLAYFNVCEFGAGIVSPQPETFPYPDSEAWRDANQYLYQYLRNAILPIPRDVLPDSIDYVMPYGTWGGAVAMDCGDEAYRQFLLEQAQKHIDYLPDSYGLCIDRLDWLRMYNERADDGIAWFRGKTARSLYTSWKRLMSDLGPMMHQAGKVIYVNNHTRRIDLLNEVDGIFDEFTYMGNSLNLMALLCYYKPAMGWVDVAQTIENEGGDSFMQRHLYMGVFPMCPFAGNDHSIRPDGTIETLYMDYGRMFDSMKGRRWVLLPNVVRVVEGFAKANLFEVDGGYVLPVMLGEEDNCVVEICGIELARDVEILYPGESDTSLGKLKRVGRNRYRIDVPLKRDCALVKLTAKH